MVTGLVMKEFTLKSMCIYFLTMLQSLVQIFQRVSLILIYGGKIQLSSPLPLCISDITHWQPLKVDS